MVAGMSIQLSRRARFLAVLAILALAWYLIGDSAPWREREPVRDAATRSEINHDSYSRNIETVHYDSNGEVDYTVRAREQHRFLNDTFWLRQPAMEVFRDQGVRWHITAQSGRILSGDPVSMVTLISEVIIRRQSSEGERQMTLYTDRLNVDPDQETMATRRPVSLTGPGFMQTAMGMRANLAQEAITFLSQVNGRYYADDTP